MPDNTLDYYSGPRNRRPPGYYRRILGWCVVLLLLGSGIAYLLLFGPLTSADIRLDSGDLRYRYFGIPLLYERMREPTRSTLISISAGSSFLPSEWVQCETYPLRPGAVPRDHLYSGMYAAATAWNKVDPWVARFIVEDIAADVQANPVYGRTGWGRVLLSLLILDAQGNWVVDPTWQASQDAIAWYAKQGLSMPTTQPATAPASLPADAVPL